MNILNRLREILNSGRNQNPDKNWIPKEGAIYFHEDFFNQVEFCPAENFNFLVSENEKISEFAEENRDGLGFTDIYKRKDNPIKLLDKKIEFKLVNETLLNLNLKRKDEVYEGYGRSSWKCKNTFAYIVPENENTQIFVVAKDEWINDFWIYGFRFQSSEEEKQKLKQILSTIGKEYDLVLNDWDLTEIVDLKNDESIGKYLNDEF